MGAKKKATEAAHRINISCINSLTGSVCKDRENESINQEKLVYLSLKEQPKTMLQVSKELGIYRANICRYVHNLRKANKVQGHHVGICPISKFRAGFLTTDSRLFKSDNTQLSLFDVWAKGGEI